jgi:hypothetical protein
MLAAALTNIRRTAQPIMYSLLLWQRNAQCGWQLLNCCSTLFLLVASHAGQCGSQNMRKQQHINFSLYSRRSKQPQ